MKTPWFTNVTRLVRVGELVWLAFLVVLAALGYLLARAAGFVPWFSLLQAAAALLTLTLTWEPLVARVGRMYFSLIVFLMSVLPIALNHFSTRLGPPLPFFSAEGVIFRLLPLLVMALVLLSLQYDLKWIIAFSVGAAVWDLVCAGINFMLSLPPNPFQPALPQPPPVFGLPAMFAASVVAVLVEFAVLLVVGTFIARLMLRLREQHAELQQLAHTDPLTGALNRRYFWELAETELERAYRYERSLALALFDLDNFKAINDQYGHAVGDAVLRHFAAESAKYFRATDLFARYGGEEFVCLLLESSPEMAQRKAEEVRNLVQAKPMTIGQEAIVLTVSIGVAGLSRGEPLSLEQLLDRADYALYQAKKNGRNRVMLFAA
jgi:diguanylate cyclase (GGDEF)-like protein